MLLNVPVIRSANAQEEITISIYNWGDANDIEANGASIARFNEKYPHVKVVEQYQEKSMTWADYIMKLLAQIAAGDAPDMCLMAIEGVHQLLSYDIMLPLNDFIENDSKSRDILDDVHPSLIEGLTVDGESYFFPSQWNGMVLYCNKQLFEEAGVQLPDGNWAWDEFLETAKALTHGEGSNKVYGFDLPTYSIFLNLLTYSNGCSTLGEDLNSSNLNDPKVIETYKFIHDLVWKYGVMPIPQAGGDVTANLINGVCAMNTFGHNVVNIYENAGFKDLYVTYFPINDKENGSHIFGAAGYGILKNSKHPEICWDLIMELSGKESQDHVAAIGVSNPVLRSSANTEQFLAFPENAQIYYNILDQGCKILPAPVKSAEFENLLTRYYYEMMAQDGDITPYMLAAHEELSELLAD